MTRIGVAVDAAGNRYVAAYRNCTAVRKIDASAARSRSWRAMARRGSQATAVRRRRRASPIPTAWRWTRRGTCTSRIGATIASARWMRAGRSRRWRATARSGSRATAVRRRRRSLNSPGGVAVDAAGNLYIADPATTASARWTRAARSRRWRATARRVRGRRRCGDGGAPRSIPPAWRWTRPATCTSRIIEQPAHPQGGCGRDDHDGGGQRHGRVLGRRRCGDGGEPRESLRRGGGRGGQPVHRGSEQPPHPQGGCGRDDHDGGGQRHARVRGRRRRGDGGEPRQSHRRGGGRGREPVHRGSRATTASARWMRAGRSRRWRATARCEFAGDGGAATAAQPQ